MGEPALSLEAEAFIDGLIGRPYAPGSDGPDVFDCYGLQFFLDRALQLGNLPMIIRPTDRALAAEEVATILKAAPERRRWRKVQFARCWDIAIMGNVDGREMHLGRCVRNKGQFGILHVDGDPGVVFDDLPALPLKGFTRMDFFRPAPSDEPVHRARDPGA